MDKKMVESGKYEVLRSDYSVIFTKILQILFCIFLGIIVGAFILEMPPLFIFVAAGGALLLIASISKPEIGMLAIVIITSSIIFEKALPLIPIGIGSFHITDVFLLFLLCMIPFKLFNDKNFRLVKTPLDKPLLFFYAAAIISVYIAVTRFSVNFNFVIRQLRVITYYLIFFAVTNLIREKRQLVFLIRGLFLITIVVAIAMIAQAAIGGSVQIMPGQARALSTLGKKYYGITRIGPPGCLPLYIMFITSICIITLEKFKASQLMRFAQIGLMTIGVILTYTRHYWATICFSLAFFMLLTSGKHKVKIIIGILIAILVMTMLIPVVRTSEGKINEFIFAASDRVKSLFAGERMFHSATLESRRIENRYAVKQIARYPIFGIGIGNSYMPGGRWLDDRGSFIHNAYLWILMKMGVVGLITFLWLSFSFLIRGFRNWKCVKDKFLKAIVIGFTLSYLGMMISNLVAPFFMQSWSVVLFGIIIGINEVIYRVDNKKIE